MRKSTDIFLLIGLSLVALILFWFNLMFGPEKIEAAVIVDLLTGGTAEDPSWSYTVQNRLNRSLLAVASGGALAIAGLILQVYFRNPLAGPGVLGISSGASLGVAAVVLGGLGVNSMLGNVGMVLAGILGALAVLLLLLFLSRFIKNAVTLLVVGLMFGYFTAALINILFQLADQADTREYVIWTLGSFDALHGNEGWIYFFGILGCSLMAILLIKPLNLLVLGSDYAASSGINIKRAKLLVILITGLLTAVVTVYCGPVGFIGIAVPQLIRLIVKSKNHLLILPITFIGGSILAVVADLIVRLGSNTLPLNTVTALIGAPIIIWTIVKLNRRAQI